MKVYMVVSSMGSYDDYHEHTEKAYLDEAKANEFMEEYNAKLKDNQIRERWKCRKGKKYDPFIWDQHEAEITVIDVEE